MKQTPPPPLFIAVALNTPAMGYTNKGGKLQLTFIESAKKKTLASISSKAAASLRAASSSLAALVAARLFGILRRFVHRQVALDPLTLAPLLLVLLIVGRQHLPAPTPKEPMQGVRGRETGALVPPVRSLASSVADPSNRRRASAARLFVTSACDCAPEKTGVTDPSRWKNQITGGDARRLRRLRPEYYKWP